MAEENLTEAQSSSRSIKLNSVIPWFSVKYKIQCSNIRRVLDEKILFNEIVCGTIAYNALVALSLYKSGINKQAFP
jgi:hypothetical protein